MNSVSPGPGNGPPVPPPLGGHGWHGGERSDEDEWADGWRDDDSDTWRDKTSSWGENGSSRKQDALLPLPVLQGQQYDSEYNSGSWNMESMQGTIDDIGLRQAEPVGPSDGLPGLSHPARGRAKTEYYGGTKAQVEYYDDDFNLETSNELPSININGKKVRSWIPLTAEDHTTPTGTVAQLSNDRYSDGYVVTPHRHYTTHEMESGLGRCDPDTGTKYAVGGEVLSSKKDRLPPPL